VTDRRDQSVCWGEFARRQPDLASFGRSRLTDAPAYLATLRKSGAPRVHPVTPIFTESGLHLFMEPTSPKGRDIRERETFALHNGVPDNAGTGGEFHVVGRGFVVEDPAVRSSAAASASYEPPSAMCSSSFMSPRLAATGTGTFGCRPHVRAWRSR
jgi:hypothetical protein